MHNFTHAAGPSAVAHGGLDDVFSGLPATLSAAPQQQQHMQQGLPQPQMHDVQSITLLEHFGAQASGGPPPAPPSTATDLHGLHGAAHDPYAPVALSTRPMQPPQHLVPSTSMGHPYGMHGPYPSHPGFHHPGAMPGHDSFYSGQSQGDAKGALHAGTQSATGALVTPKAHYREVAPTHLHARCWLQARNRGFDGRQNCTTDSCSRLMPWEDQRRPLPRAFSSLWCAGWGTHVLTAHARVHATGDMQV